MPAQVAHLLPARPERSHKGTFGRVLIMGGSGDYPGAPVLAALGAIEAGSGLVTVVSAGQNSGVAHPVGAVILPLVQDDSNPGTLTLAHLAVVFSRLERCRGLVIGPGLGTDQATVTAVRELLARIGTHERTLTIVVDADALNAISPVAPDRWPIGSRVGSSGADRGRSIVFTPHMAEMARLTGQTVDAVGRDPVWHCTRIGDALGCRGSSEACPKCRRVSHWDGGSWHVRKCGVGNGRKWGRACRCHCLIGGTGCFSVGEFCYRDDASCPYRRRMGRPTRKRRAACIRP